MNRPAPLLLTTGGPAEPLAVTLEAAWAAGGCVGLADPAERHALEAALGREPRLGETGAAVLLGSGGSSGARRWCLQPLEHLQASARATGLWLQSQGLDPAACLHLDPLPLHHVSGLLPLVRSRLWGAALRFLPSAWMRQPALLAAEAPHPAERPTLISLVPTQLQRLISSPEGLDWLRGCALIWVGGAALPAATASLARREGLRLAPCFGATETAAMVCALPPGRFLAGEEGCGPALADVELRLEAGSGAVEIRSGRLCPGWLEGGRLRPLPRDGDGWWRSGDAGLLLPGGGLRLLGRRDGALISGGETLFPEQLEARLTAEAAAAGLPLAAALVLGLPDPEWGDRLVALLRPTAGADAERLRAGLQELSSGWRAAERPRHWYLCPELAPSAAGKWERGRWRRWLEEAIRAGS